jgi:hypothetical protein
MSVTPTSRRRIDTGAILLTLLTAICALLWFFPIYWAIITSLRFDQDTVTDFALFPKNPTLSAYIFTIENSNLLRWYFNSTVTSVTITIITVAMAACTGYAINAVGKVAVMVDLGPTYFAGGVLTVQSYGTGTTLDSVLYVGTGCPTWFGSFNGLRGNDDAAGGTGAAAGGAFFAMVCSINSTAGDSGVASRFDGIVARSAGAAADGTGSTLSTFAPMCGIEVSLLPSVVERMASLRRARSMSPELSATPLDGGGMFRTLAGALELSGPVCWDNFARSRRLWRSRSRSLLSVMVETRVSVQRNPHS